jgi:hypothetical protein
MDIYIYIYIYIYPGLADLKNKTKKKLSLRPGSEGKDKHSESSLVSDVPSAYKSERSSGEKTPCTLVV